MTFSIPAPSFFSPPRPLPLAPVVCTVEGHPKLVLEYCVRPHLDPITRFNLREIFINIRVKSSRRYVAQGRLLLARAEKGCKETVVLDALREDANAWEFCDMLSRNCEQGFVFFRHGAVLSLEYFEIHGDLRGAGLGQDLALHALNLLAKRYSACLLVLKPWPLQFLKRFDENPNSLVGASDFKKATLALSMHYRVKWGFSRIGRTPWLGRIPTGTKLKTCQFPGR